MFPDSIFKFVKLEKYSDIFLREPEHFVPILFIQILHPIPRGGGDYKREWIYNKRKEREKVERTRGEEDKKNDQKPNGN